MKPYGLAIGLIAAALLVAPQSRAQVMLDVTKINCDQYVHAKISTPNYIASWLSGYYAAKRNAQVVDVQALQANVTKLEAYCYEQKNFNVTVMKAIEELFGER